MENRNRRTAEPNRNRGYCGSGSRVKNRNRMRFSMLNLAHFTRLHVVEYDGNKYFTKSTNLKHGIKFIDYLSKYILDRDVSLQILVLEVKY
jgi:hypothetical protein